MEIYIRQCLLSLLLLGFNASFAQPQSLLNPERNEPHWYVYSQLNNIRVYDALMTTNASLEKLFSDSNVVYPPRYIYWRSFKAEQELELWAKDSAHQPFKKIKTYPVYTTCGDLGPKRRQGDMQIPEGFYKIDRFNPNSSYWLSFKINYPNKSDSILGDKKRLGGDIFIHGDTITIGCLPMTDSLIKEIYWISLLNRNLIDSLEEIPVHIFPIRLNKNNWKYLYQEYYSDAEKIKFWNSLQGMYDYFEDSHTLPPFTVGQNGYYIIQYPTKKTLQHHALPPSRLGESGR
jgi:murein L,D-transpeptidase YafK